MTSGRLQLRAAIAQRSGEDWRGVKLSLSTANLERATELPELRSLRIGRAQPAPPKSGWREPPPGLDELFGSFDASVRPHTISQPRLQKTAAPVMTDVVPAEEEGFGGAPA